jgi:hypothetical protein
MVTTQLLGRLQLFSEKEGAPQLVAIRELDRLAGKAPMVEDQTFFFPPLPYVGVAAAAALGATEATAERPPAQIQSAPQAGRAYVYK